MDEPSVSLDRIVDIDVGFAFKSADFLDHGAVRLLRGDNIGHGITRWGRSAFYPETGSDFSRYELEIGDVVLAMDRPWIASGLKHAVIGQDDLPAYLVQRVARLRAKAGHCQAFIRYLVQTPEFSEHVISVQTGTAIPHISIDQIKRYRLAYVPLAQQRAIAEVLGALDVKIAANTKLAQTASRLGAALRDESMNSAVENSRLSDLVTTQYGVTTPATHGLGPVLIRVTDMNKQPWIEWNNAPNCRVSEAELEKYRIREGDILVARMADPGKSVYIDRGVPQAVFASYLVRLCAIEPRHALWIAYFLQSKAYIRYAQGAMTGSVQKNMNARVITAVQVPMPPTDSLIRFNDVIMAIRGAMNAALRESAALARTRDTLLPQLMSGKLRVRDAEQLVEEVV